MTILSKACFATPEDRLETEAKIDYLVKALRELYELHMDATGVRPRTSKADIENYYARIENKVKRALLSVGIIYA